MRGISALLLSVALLVGCASEPLPSASDAPPLPAALAAVRDLRGPFRAAFCGREAMPAAQCAETLYRFAGERESARPPPVDAARFRLLFVPGFLASCFPAIHTFGDVMRDAQAQGFAVDYLDAAGRSGVAANARELARQVDALPQDARRLVIVGHSKGAVDALQMLVDRPDIAQRTAALLSVAGALQGSPLADSLGGLYGITFGALPFTACTKGDGEPVVDLRPANRQMWWKAHGESLTVPIYALVSVPEMTRLATTLYTPFLMLAHDTRYNDGMLPAGAQVARPGALLGVVNADHLSVAIPRPDQLPYVLWFSPVPFPHTDAILAAIDVIAADLP